MSEDRDSLAKMTEVEVEPLADEDLESVSGGVEGDAETNNATTGCITNNATGGCSIGKAS